MPTFTIHQAKTQLSELIRRAEAGEEIVIARGDLPVVVLKKLDSTALNTKRLAGRGALKGKMVNPADDALIGPMSETELAEAFGADFPALLGATPSDRR